MLMSLMLFAAESTSLYTGPHPEETAVYDNWITGCDNERNCSAIALRPTDQPDNVSFGHLEVLIEQLPHHHQPTVTIKLPMLASNSAKYTLYVDLNPIALPSPQNGRYIISGPNARLLIQKMQTAAWVTLRVPGGAAAARASLLGLNAALGRIDDQQGKSGTPQALRHVGTKKSSGAPGYGVWLTRPARPIRPPAAPDAGAMAALRDADQCKAENDNAPAAPRVVRLDYNNSLMIMPWACANGAYNHYSNIMIVNDSGQVTPATFDYDNGITGEGPSNVLVNVAWYDSKRELESFVRHRGTGDCGRVDRFIWNGEQFLLAEQQIMPECRMAFDRIRTWKVDVVDR